MSAAGRMDRWLESAVASRSTGTRVKASGDKVSRQLRVAGSSCAWAAEPMAKTTNNMDLGIDPLDEPRMRVASSYHSINVMSAVLNRNYSE